MLYELCSAEAPGWMNALGLCFAFLGTILATKLFAGKLPQDGGRQFAVNGSLSKGKPRGAGIIFVLVFLVASILFIPVDTEMAIYLICLVAAMLTGFLDDAAKNPWSELKKGLLDLVIAIGVAVNFLMHKPNVFYTPFTDKAVHIPVILYGILIVILVLVCINVTNCTDGVDGLCGMVSLVTIASIYALLRIFEFEEDYQHMILLFMACIMAYLLFNAKPSFLLMGDAGSRTIGLFIAIMFLISRSPIYFVFFGLVLIIDGGMGLIKIVMIRYLKVKNFMKNIRTPIHDYYRKTLEWSDTQVVIRFMLIQAIINIVILSSLV